MHVFSSSYDMHVSSSSYDMHVSSSSYDMHVSYSSYDMEALQVCGSVMQSVDMYPPPLMTYDMHVSSSSYDIAGKRQRDAKRRRQLGSLIADARLKLLKNKMELLKKKPLMGDTELPKNMIEPL